MCHVASAAGTTTVDAVDLEWTDRDRFVILNWAEHSFANRSTTDEAILLSVHVIPTLEAFGLYCETPAGRGRQGGTPRLTIELPDTA